VNNYLISLFCLSFILLFQYFFLYKLKFKNFFIKKNLINRWSNENSFLVGGPIFLFSIILIYIFNLFFFEETIITKLDLLILIIFFIIGFYDDQFNLNGKLKLTIYFLIIYLITILYFYQNINFSFVNCFILSLLLFVIFVSLNIIDNIDGLFTLNFISIILYFIYLLLFNNILITTLYLISILLIALFFLTLNLFKSHNYLGDSGSNLLSIFLVLFFLKIQNTIDFYQPFFVHNLAMLIGIFSYSLFDIFYVSSKRLYNGFSPLIGGSDHSSHVIAIYFKSKFKSVMLILMINSIVLILAFFYYKAIIGTSLFIFFILFIYLSFIFFLIKIDKK
jgi:UDP-GlcNAc:undecaprenyl-phosphate/decaprenyl-phosphate GlcNAc-1-phosphate transferase